MARFPIREFEVVQLARDVATGLAANPELFADCPVKPEEIQNAIARYDASYDRKTAAANQALQETADNARDREAVADLVKQALRYAENATLRDDIKLHRLGWGAPRAKTSRQNILPGQVGVLRVTQEGKDWVKLEWNPPLDGGSVAAYRVERRRLVQGEDWTIAGSSAAAGATIRGQPTGIELEYRVIAFNKAGDGPASNLVRVVL
jgi:hypothetical protein